MRNKRIFLLVTLCIAGILAIIMFDMGAFGRASKLPKPPPGYTWSLIFEDDFSGTTLDTTKWATCYDWYDSVYKGCTNSGNNELEWYTPQQVSVKEGQVTLTAREQPTPGWNKTYEQIYPYVSGMISTGRDTYTGQPKREFKYGYYEARIKVNSGKGVWPAFWLLPADHSWPPEIDIMEFLGDQPNRILMTYHWPGDDQKPQKDETSFTSQDFTKDWHTYAVNWQPGRIDWYIDGVQRKSVASEHVPSKSMELIANLAIGGNLPGNPDDSTKFPVSASIDYIRVYSLSPSGTQ